METKNKKMLTNLPTFNNWKLKLIVSSLSKIKLNQIELPVSSIPYDYSTKRVESFKNEKLQLQNHLNHIPR